MTNVRPLNNIVLLQRIVEDEVTEGGIILPESAKEPTRLAIVRAKGEGTPLPDGSVAPIKVEVGATVAYVDFSGTEITVDGTEYLLIEENRILAVVGDADDGEGEGWKS